jgi:hypothetical protein
MSKTDSSLTTTQSRLLLTQRTLKTHRAVVACCNCGSTDVVQQPATLRCQGCGSEATLDGELFAVVDMLRGGEDRASDAILDIREKLNAADPPTCGEKPALMVVGPGEAGKDYVSRWFNVHTTLSYTRSTSWYLAEFAATRWEETADQIYRTRRDRREQLYELGRELRAKSPGVLVTAALKTNDIVCGARDGEEVDYARRKNVVNLVLWVANDRAPKDPTMNFGPERCDYILPNQGTEVELMTRLERLAKLMGVYTPH